MTRHIDRVCRALAVEEEHSEPVPVRFVDCSNAKCFPHTVENPVQLCVGIAPRAGSRDRHGLNPGCRRRYPDPTRDGLQPVLRVAGSGRSRLANPRFINEISDKIYMICIIIHHITISMCTYGVNYAAYYYSRPMGAHVTGNHGLLRVATGWPMPTLTRTRVHPYISLSKKVKLAYIVPA